MFAKIKKISGQEITLITNEVDINKIQRLTVNQRPTVELTVADQRRITPDQRAKIYALINDLCNYTGDVPDFWKANFKFQVEMTFNVPEFSLSDCSVTIGNYMILTILNFLFENDIPFKTQTWDSLPSDYPKQMLCLKNKRCVICGKKADIAHFKAVGMGRNRHNINHVGMYIMTLCRKHHTEQHQTGINNFMQKYHLKPIKVTSEIAKKFKLGRINNE